jgi:hypothetical protein
LISPSLFAIDEPCGLGRAVMPGASMDTSSHAESWTPELETLLSTWHRRMDACQHAYYLEAERYRRWHFWLGIPP